MTESGKKVTIWNRTFVCCVLAQMFFVFSHQFTSPLVSSYAAFLGAGATIVGMLSGLYYGIAFAMRPISGPLVTVQNRKILMIVAYSLGFIVNVLYASTSSIPLFILTRVIHGVQYSLVGSLLLTVASSSLPKEKMGSGIGVFGVAGVFGTALGPSIGIALREWGNANWGDGGGYKVTFIAAAICCGLSLIPSLLVQNQRALTREEREALGPWYKNIVALPAIPPAVLMFLYSMCFILYNTFLVPYAAQYGITGISTFFTVYAVFSLISRPISGRILDRRGPAVLFFPCSALFIVSLLIVGSANSLLPVLIAAAIGSIGYSSLQPTIQTMAMTSVPPEKGGVASNTNYFGLDLGFFIGPTVGGLVYAATGSYHTMYRFAIIPVIIGLLVFTVYYFTKLRKKPSPEELIEQGETNA